MKEYNKFPESAKEKIIEQRNRYVEYKKLAEDQGIKDTTIYYKGWVEALNWLME